MKDLKYSSSSIPSRIPLPLRLKSQSTISNRSNLSSISNTIQASGSPFSSIHEPISHSIILYPLMPRVRLRRTSLPQTSIHHFKSSHIPSPISSPTPTRSRSMKIASNPSLTSFPEPVNRSPLSTPSLPITSSQKQNSNESSRSLVELHASSTNSLVYNHLKQLLSQLEIPNQESHRAWAFDSPYSRPRPSVAFDEILEDEIGIDDEIRSRIDRLRSDRRKNLPIFRQGKLKGLYNFRSTPAWARVTPVKACSSLDLIHVTASLLSSASTSSSKSSVWNSRLRQSRKM